MSEDKALHYSGGKLGVDQIPAEVLAALGLVYTYGETKYARDNWKKGTDYSQFIGSLKRHLLAFELGEDIDPESGCEHLAHILWNAATLIYYGNHELGTDDREFNYHTQMSRVRETMQEVQTNARKFLEEKNG